MRRRFPDLLHRRGSAAVEFAIFVPLLLIFLMGTVEMATAYRTSAKLNAVVANVANAIAASQAVSAGAMTTISAQPTVTASAVSNSVYASFTSGSELVQDVSLADLCLGAALGTQPYPSGGMTLDIASVTEETAAPAATYDMWEYDQTVTTTPAGPSCGPTASSPLQPSSTTLLPSATTPPATALSLISVPCDNVIIVRATLPYSGLFGLFFTSSVTLTQTAYSRWAIAQPQTELMCAGCALPGNGGASTLTPDTPPTPPYGPQICDSLNTATN